MDKVRTIDSFMEMVVKRRVSVDGRCGVKKIVLVCLIFELQVLLTCQTLRTSLKGNS